VFQRGLSRLQALHYLSPWLFFGVLLLLLLLSALI
jgi:hypothetical protein